jgi:ATP-dependent helicase Lhr and Lhr-like helicase
MGFDRLHPSVQHHIVNSLGWRELRPLQEDAVGPIIDGSSCLLIAPTAGGKTEAAILPVLSRMLSEQWDGLSVLYVCPLRALLNNLEARLSFYCALVGRTCGLWHGDVGQASRAAILRNPPDILLTTPESLEAMLISRRTDRRYFFGSLRTVIIDEVHAFAGDDRGWHLLALLERIADLAGSQPQRIGLSATIGNPKDILAWMTRHSSPACIIAPEAGLPVETGVQLDYVGSIENAALVVSKLYRGEKRLVFCDSRAQAERIASLLRGSGTVTFVNHSSLSVDERRQAERAFRESRDCVIVATSTLELGIDVGDLDRVLQIDAPRTVASFLQRLGRTGRRAESHRNCLFLTTRRESLLRAAALLRLWKEGFVEQLQPPAAPYPVVAQQIMAVIRQNGGASRRFDDSTIRRAMGQPNEITQQMITHMLESGILFEDSGVLGLGPEGERLFGAKNFMALMSVFETPLLFQVICGTDELGWVHPFSFAKFRQQSVIISLGGRAWEVIHIDRERSVAHVAPVDALGRSRWLGESTPLGHRLCRAVRDVLAEEEIDPLWSRRAVSEITAARIETTVARSKATVVSSDSGEDQAVWWTFGGLNANASIAEMIKHCGGSVRQFDNYSLEFQGSATFQTHAALLDSIRPSQTEEVSAAAISPTRVKFWECVPNILQWRFIKARFSDAEQASQILSEPRVYSVKTSR